MDFKSILRRIIEYNTEKSSDPELIINDFDPPANKTEIDVPCKKWIGSLNRIRDTIKTFISQTEGDFLCLGKALQDFYNDAEKISAISLSATNLISGDETAIAIDRLQGILDRINGYFEDLNHRSVQKKGSIGHILNIFDSINGAFEGFMKIVKVLNILGISIKIESTRFTDKKNNFNILADNVRELSGFINSKSSDMLDGSISISNTIKKTFSEIITFEYKQFNQAKEILNNIKTNRLLLKERYDLFSAASKQISARSNEISGSIGEIVTFIQFHDITRQEIEHVKEAIDDLILRLNNGHSTDDESEIPDCTNFIKQAHIVSDTCKLQISQLHHASDEMVVAVEKIIKNLEEIGKNVVTMVQEVQEIAKAANKDKSSFLSEIESGITNITKALSENTTSSQELSKMTDSIINITEEMSVFLQGIEEIRTEIDMIALNARIKSYHAGDEGAGMGDIAEAIQKSSEDAHLQTTMIADKLKEIISTSKTLDDEINNKKDERDGRGESMLEDLEVLLNSIRKINESIESVLIRMNETSQKLAEDINGAVSEITVHEVFARTIDEIISGLEEIVTETLQVADNEIRSDSIDSLKEIEAIYTMESERNIHKSYINLNNEGLSVSGYTAINESAAKTAKDSGDALGDNVELF